MAVRRAQPEQGLQLSYSFVRLFCYRSYLRPRRNVAPAMLSTASQYEKPAARSRASSCSSVSGVSKWMNTSAGMFARARRRALSARSRVSSSSQQAM